LQLKELSLPSFIVQGKPAQWFLHENKHRPYLFHIHYKNHARPKQAKNPGPLGMVLDNLTIQGLGDHAWNFAVG